MPRDTHAPHPLDLSDMQPMIRPCYPHHAHIHRHVDVNMHKKCASLPPPSEYIPTIDAHTFPLPPPQKENPSRNIIHPQLQLVDNYPTPVYDNTNFPAEDHTEDVYSLTLSHIFATTKASSDTGVAQILIFIIYKIFHKIYIFCCKCCLLNTSDPEIFFWGTYNAWIWAVSAFKNTTITLH